MTSTVLIIAVLTGLAILIFNSYKPWRKLRRIRVSSGQSGNRL